MSGVKNIFGNLATRLALFPISFVASALISRFLGPSEKGIYSYLALLSSMSIILLSFGFHSGIRYWVSSKIYAIGDVIFSMIIVGLIQSSIISGILLLFWKFQWLGQTGVSITEFQIFMLIIAILATMQNTYLQRVLIGDDQFKFVNQISLFSGILSPLLLLLLVIYLEFRVDGTVISLALIQFMTFFITLVFIFRKYKINLKLESKLIRQSFKYGIKSWIGDITYIANARTDQLILGGISSSKALGLYSISVTISELLWILPDSAGQILFNKVVSETDEKRAIDLTLQMHRIIFFLTLMTGLVLAMISYPLIILVFSDQYAKSVVPLLILIPGSLSFVTQKMMSKLFSGSSNVLKSSQIGMLTSVFLMLFYLILIPSFGIIGAAFATSFGYIIGSLYTLFLLKKHYKIRVIDIYIIRGQDFSDLYVLLKALKNR